MNKQFKQLLYLLIFFLLSILSVSVFLMETSSDRYVRPIENITTEPISTTTDTILPTTQPSSSTTSTENTVSETIPPSPTQSSSTLPTQANIPPMEHIPKADNITVMAWIYPSEPGCNAQNEYRDGRKIDILKPEFFTVNGGSLSMFDTKNSSCNGFSTAFINDIKKYSKQQFITVSSASTEDMDTFFESALGEGDDINTLVSFVVKNNLTGIELDFEDFGGWNQSSYRNFLMFVEKLGSELQANAKELMIDGPAIANNTEQSWYMWHYEDFINLPVNHIVIMAYDYQFDHGTGEPIAPLDWMDNVIKWVSSKYPTEKLSVGIPSYGYEGIIGKKPFIRTYNQLKALPGFATASRDKRSSELTWRSGNNVYFYQDSESIKKKISRVRDSGLNSVSIWHLGGNLWY